MTDPTLLEAAGWVPIPIADDTARLYGLPIGTQGCYPHGYRRLVADGVLVALVARGDNGWTLALTHVAHDSLTTPIPGRMPRLVEIYATRRLLIPEDALMVLVLEPMSYALRLRWERTHQPTPPPPAPGLPTTVKCVQMYVEAVTDDVVFGTEDIATPATVWPVVPRHPDADPVGPVPDELLGDAEAALENDENDEDDDGM